MWWDVLKCRPFQIDNLLHKNNGFYKLTEKEVNSSYSKPSNDSKDLTGLNRIKRARQSACNCSMGYSNTKVTVLSTNGYKTTARDKKDEQMKPVVCRAWHLKGSRISYESSQIPYCNPWYFPIK